MTTTMLTFSGSSCTFAAIQIYFDVVYWFIYWDLLYRVWTNAVWFERLCSIIGFPRGLHETERKLSI